MLGWVKNYYGQVLSSNDVVIYRMHENSSSKAGRDDFSFAAYVWEENFTAKIEGFKLVFAIKDNTRPGKKIAGSTKVLKEFNKLAKEDIDELVEISASQSHSLEDFIGSVQEAYRANLYLFGSRFYRTVAFKAALSDPSVFYDEEDNND